MTKWEPCYQNDGRQSFAYNDYLWEISIDDAINGVHIDDAKHSLDRLFILLAALDVIWACDTGDGEPTVWLKK